MEKMVNKTVDAFTRFGERLERQIIGTGTDEAYYERSGSGSLFPSQSSAFSRPLDKKQLKKQNNAAGRRDSGYGGVARQFSSDNLAANPGYSSFNNYRQNPQANRPPYGTGIGSPLNYAYNSSQNSFSNSSFNSNYGNFNNQRVNPFSGAMQGNGAYGAEQGNGVYESMQGNGAYGAGRSSSPYGAMQGNGAYENGQGNVGYAPEYYIAERRQVELVPAPQPRIIQQQVPVPYAVDRPVPQPYPVEVQRPVYIDRPVPYPVATPVPVDRPVPVPYPVAVASPPPPPVCVPVPVPTPVPCYIPIGVPVPSPPPSPVMFEQSVTHTQRWVTGSPAMMNQQRYLAGSPAMGMNPYMSYGNASFIRWSVSFL